MLVAAYPWCGRKLPGSRREQWVAELENLGYRSALVAELPAPFDSPMGSGLSEANLTNEFGEQRFSGCDAL